VRARRTVSEERESGGEGERRMIVRESSIGAEGGMSFD